jgi:hydroxyethylthiazole kinase-like sugar kinase family protein
VATFISCFAGAYDDLFIAAIAGTAILPVCAELIHEKNIEGPESFKVHLYDQIFNLNPKQFIDQIKISKV